MRNILQSFLATLNGYNVPPAPPVVEEEPDPRDAKVVLTQGQFDDLNAQLVQIHYQNAVLLERVDRMRRAETLAVRRLLNFADAVSMVVQTDKVSKGTPVGETGAEYVLMDGNEPLLTLRFEAFGKIFSLAPAGTISATIASISAEFEADGTLSRKTRLILKGYALDVRSARNGESHDSVIEAELQQMLSAPADTQETPAS